MDGNTMRTLREYIHELRSRDWNHNGTDRQPAFDTTIEDDSNWGQGDRSRDDGRGENRQG